MGRSTKKRPRPTAGPLRLISETGSKLQELHRAESDGAMDNLDFLLSVLAATFAAAQSVFMRILKKIRRTAILGHAGYFRVSFSLLLLRVQVS